ncbi:MAG: signal peptidase II [Clostridia bacterium]|nr:signal peptidase II [Clostridia bacterium]
MLIWLMIIAGIVFIDQLTKWLTVINLDLYETFPLIENVFHFTYVRNTGAAFSIFNEPDQRWIFMSISSVAIVALAIYLWFNRKKGALLCVALSFIIGGGIGNMIDRCLLKYVIDMLDFRLINFAIFNVADSFVCVGVGLFALAVIIEEVNEMKKEKAAKLVAQSEEAVTELNEDEENGTDLNN